jgi:hypothetical protein
MEQNATDITWASNGNHARTARRPAADALAAWTAARDAAAEALDRMTAKPALVVVCYLCCGQPDPRCPRCAGTGADPGRAA